MSSPNNHFTLPGDPSNEKNSVIVSTSEDFTTVIAAPERAQLRSSRFSIARLPVVGSIFRSKRKQQGHLEISRPVLHVNGQIISEPSPVRRADSIETAPPAYEDLDEKKGLPVYSSQTVNSSGSSITDRDSLPLVRPGTPLPQARKRNCFAVIIHAIINALNAVKAAILRHVDPKTLIEMIDFRELVWPFSVWKYTVLACVGAIIAGIIVSEHYTHWIEASMAITRSNMLPVLIIVLGLEPLMITIILLVAKVPDMSPEDAAVLNADPASLEAKIQTPRDKDDHRTALVIPCHNSDHTAMKKVLESAYPHFRPQDIFIVDNGRSKYPPADFRSFIREQHPDIVYIWSPIGSKNAAQLVGAIAARNYEFIMTVDDDVSIPPNFVPPIDKIDDLTKGVAFPLRAMDADGNTPLFMVAWQDCEYKMSGLSKLAESRLCGVLYPHGAGWFCERETLIDLISNYHSIDFIAEDVNTGLSMQRMKKRIAFDARIVLETEVPTTILGPGLNWWHQRKNSWEMGRHGRLFGFADRLFLSLNGQTTIQGIITQKSIHLYAIASIVVDWLRVPIIVTMGGEWQFWRQALLLSLVAMFPLLAFKFIKARRRPDLQPGFWACVTYPFYKQLYALVSVVGGMRSVVYYIGGHKRPRTVRQMMKDNDERIFWKDPRFETNPGYLADEAEALKAAEVAAEAAQQDEPLSSNASWNTSTAVVSQDGSSRPPSSAAGEDFEIRPCA